MLEKLEQIEQTYDELTAKLADPDVLANPGLFRDTSRALAELNSVVELYQRYKKTRDELDQTAELLGELERGDDMYEMAAEEKGLLEETLASIEETMKEELAPKDPNEKRNAVLEIRAGTGGDEASLFAAELFRMYSRYADDHGWKVDILDLSESGIRGIKEVSAIVEGRGAFATLRYEAGVHRVQRVPETEASGRIHTSAVTVAVLPEAEDIEIEIEPSDLRVDTYCASGPGGQGVNTTYSAVRLTHQPTGLVVTCQDERSQIKNKAKAMRVLKSRLLEIEEAKASAEMGEERRRMVGSGDRSEKIRTYNFPQNRVTDHRVGLSVHKLPSILEGDLEPLIVPLQQHFEAERLRQTGDGDPV
ncbi:MAG: peptide chain release factor 1 [Holophagales bacterium]|nr:peptide chain release factor 1 [Holophagales bacterium]MYF96766.1 peptide chain release factor 1 [Holophagales bacterium]